MTDISVIKDIVTVCKVGIFHNKTSRALIRENKQPQEWFIP